MLKVFLRVEGSNMCVTLCGFLSLMLFTLLSCSPVSPPTQSPRGAPATQAPFLSYFFFFSRRILAALDLPCFPLFKLFPLPSSFCAFLPFLSCCALSYVDQFSFLQLIPTVSSWRLLKQNNKGRARKIASSFSKEVAKISFNCKDIICYVDY